jgi:hypothetical protein
MKIVAYSLLFLSCMSHAYERATITSALSKELSALSTRKSSTLFNCDGAFQCPPKPTCSFDCRGPRGKPGHRGRQGVTGATGATGPAALCGLNSLFINAPMMTDEFGNSNPDITFANTYGPSTSFTTPTVTAWNMIITFFPQSPKTMQFIIPDDMDTTQPITLTLHCFNNFNVEATGRVAFQVQADYKSDGEEIGTSAPATGFAETLLTADHVVVDPTGFGTNQQNIRYFTLSVPLNGALIAGNTWAYLDVLRVAPAINQDYSASVYLTAVSIDYTRICS